MMNDEETLEKTREKIECLFKCAGAARMREIRRDQIASTECVVIAVDKLLEAGEIREVTPEDVPMENRVFVRDIL